MIAHRGAWGELPENSLEAFEEAWRLGADMVELDVRRTDDGHLVAHHDPIGPLRHDELSGPLLRDVVTQLGHRIALNLELKERGCEREVVSLLERSGREDCLITSFLDDVVRETKTAAPQLKTGLVVDAGPGENAVRRARACDADLLVLEARIPTVAELPCLVWTVNDAAQIERFLCDPAVVGVITDVPAVALACRARLSGRTAPATPRSAPALPVRDGAGGGGKGRPSSA